MMPAVYFDMDGVLAKWESCPVEETYKAGFYLSRKPDEKAINLCRELQKICDVKILSCAYENGHAGPEKILWVSKVFKTEAPDMILVPYGKRKIDYVPHAGKSFLVDDFSENLHTWSDECHFGIKWLNGINGTKGTWKGFSVACTMEQDEINKKVKRFILREGGKDE